MHDTKRRITIHRSAVEMLDLVSTTASTALGYLKLQNNRPFFNSKIIDIQGQFSIISHFQ